MEEFVREKIKDKPINKRKIVIRLLVAAACGVVFAITACLVAAFLWPKLKPLESDDALVKETETETEISNSFILATGQDWLSAERLQLLLKTSSKLTERV